MYKVTTDIDHSAETYLDSGQEKFDCLSESGLENLYIFDSDDYYDGKFTYIYWRTAQRNGELYRRHLRDKIKNFRGVDEDEMPEL
jgi:hypothetical protein